MGKLIFIDDDNYYQLMVKNILSNYTIASEASYSSDGLSVINFLKENKEDETILPDFIFIDLSMPNFNGWDFLEALQYIYISLKKSIWVYVVSTSVNPDHIKKTKSYPFVKNFIAKPLTKSLLETILVFNRKDQ